MIGKAARKKPQEAGHQGHLWKQGHLGRGSGRQGSLMGMGKAGSQVTGSTHSGKAKGCLLYLNFSPLPELSFYRGQKAAGQGRELPVHYATEPCGGWDSARLSRNCSVAFPSPSVYNGLKVSESRGLQS